MDSYTDNQTGIQRQFELLLHIEPTGVNFLTCSLDTQGNRIQARAILKQMQLSYRQTLSNRQQRVDFDHALKMVEVYMESHDNHIKSILIFCRGIIGGQFFMAIPLSVYVGNSIRFQSTPAIKQLHEIVKQESDKNIRQYWNTNFHWEEDSREYNQGLLTRKHLESDEISYSLAHDELQWPEGSPVMLRNKAGRLPINSFDEAA